MVSDTDAACVASDMILCLKIKGIPAAPNIGTNVIHTHENVYEKHEAE